MGNELNTAARLAIATVMEKAAKDTKESLRAELLDDMTEEWRRTKSDRRPITIDGTSRTGNEVSIKVGTVSLTMEKAHWERSDEEAILNYATEAGLLKADLYIDEGREQEAAAILEAAGFDGFTLKVNVDEAALTARLTEGDPVDMETGELVPGLRWVNEKPKGIRVTGGRADNSIEAKVDQALNVLGVGSIHALLEGGTDA